MKGQTARIDQDKFIYSFIKATPSYLDPFKAEVNLTEACIKGTKLTDYFLFKVEAQYCVLNLNTGYMVCWYDIFGRDAWVNRPTFDPEHFINQFTKVLTEMWNY